MLLLQLEESCFVSVEECNTDVGVMLSESPSDGVLHFHKSNLPLSFEFERLCEMVSKHGCCVLYVEALALVARQSDIEATSC